MLPVWPGPDESDASRHDGRTQPAQVHRDAPRTSLDASPHDRPTSAQADAAARRHWESDADAYQAEHGEFLAAGFLWGPEGRTEAELRVLGPVGTLRGLDVLEIGCGAGQCSAWVATQGARAVGVDISVAQLRHAQAPSAGSGVKLVAGTATALPFAEAAFDLAFSSYGAVQFVADLDLLLAEVARVLRPGGRWCFSVTHPIRWAFPDEPDEAGLAVSGSYFDRTPYVERDDSGEPSYAEFHRTLGDYVTALVRAGFVVDDLVEPEWPDWNDRTWGGWSPLRGWYLPGTVILGARLPE